jgi:hypothetical protein
MSGPGRVDERPLAADRGCLGPPRNVLSGIDGTRAERLRASTWTPRSPSNGERS